MPRRSDNVGRSAQGLLRLLSAALHAFGRPLLATLTFEGNAWDPEYAGHALSRFQKRVRIAYPDSHTVFVPELSPTKGRIHFHGLLFGLPDELGDIKAGRRTISRGRERSDRVLSRLWGEGYVDLVQTDGSMALAYYLCKYFTKHAGHVLFTGMRIPRVSHGFPRPAVYRGTLATLAIEALEGYKPVREWSSKGGEKIEQFFGRVTKRTYMDTSLAGPLVLDEEELRNRLGVPESISGDTIAPSDL